MASLDQTPGSKRVHISFFGLRNAGKSTLVNRFCSQNVAIVADLPGTTTDPVSKAIEIPPLGPCLVTDTAGLDDDDPVVGAERVRRSLEVLAKTDIAVWVGDGFEKWKDRFTVPVITYNRGDDVDALKEKIASFKTEEDPGLSDGIASPGDRIVLVCPVDEAAPKGRLILPQVQLLRECLDRHIIAVVCCPEELSSALGNAVCVVTDAQAYASVRETLSSMGEKVRVISFSELFARQKGDVEEYSRSMEKIKELSDSDIVLVAEGCSHHRQCNDIGTVQIPRAIEALSGSKPRFVFSSGGDFRLDASPSLVVHCGGCMLTRREMRNRIQAAKNAGIPIVNYGMVLERYSRLFPRNGKKAL